MPFAIADATALTEAGYVGEDVENILLKLIQAADYDVKKAETGIIYIDEIDKVARKSREPVDHPRRVGRGRAAGAAQDPRGHHGVGAAPGWAASTRTRSSSRSTPGTSCSSAVARSPASSGSSSPARVTPASGSPPRSAATRDIEASQLLQDVLPEDLVKFGLIPEFIGRLPDHRRRRPPRPRGPHRDPRPSPATRCSSSTRRSSSYEDVELEFTDDALVAVADQALLRGTGARGLRAILEEVLLDIMYDIPSRTDVGKVVIDRDVVLDKVNPTIVPRDAKAARPEARRYA